ncbi:MAG: hypothetical protein AAF957_04640 [Planctomycetota bacterium]
MNRIAPSAAAAAALFLAPLAAADVLVLKDGRIIDGPKMEQKDGHVTVEFEAGAVEVKDALVDILLQEGKEIAFVPQTDEEREKFEKGFVRFEGRWKKIRSAKKEIQKRVASRVDEAREDVAHSEWMDRYQVESSHFQWHFTTPRRTTQRYIDACDAYFEIFKKDWKIKRDKKKPKLAINFFADRGEFQQVSGAGGGTLAYFMFIGDYDLCAFYDRLDPEFTEQVLFHELGHYLHKLIDEDFRYPHWPGESLCEYYGGASWDPDKKKLTVGQIQNGRLKTIQSDIERGEKIGLRKMITTRGFYDYTWGWSFVHFLMQDPKRAKQFKKFFLGLATDKSVKRERSWSQNLKNVTGEEVLRYFMECMKLEDENDLLKLEGEWYDYIENDLSFEGENALVWEAKTASSLGERDRARKLYQTAYKRSPEAMPASAHFAYAQMLGSSMESRQHYRMAVDKAPLTPVYRWSLGEALEKSSKEGEKEEAELHKAIALELDPYVERDHGRIVITMD